MYYFYSKRRSERDRILEERRAEEERIREEQLKEAERERLEALKSSACALLADSLNFLTPCLIIDSNIWMNENYYPFFLALAASCHKHDYRLTLFGPQFDEISNIKKNVAYGDTRNIRARIAINRIEEFQKRKLLKIEPVTIDAQRGAYADPMIVKLITSRAKEGIKSTFFSDDKELRIRVRQHLEDYAKAKWNIVEISSILPKCKIFNEAWNLGLIKGEFNSPPPQLWCEEDIPTPPRHSEFDLGSLIG